MAARATRCALMLLLGGLTACGSARGVRRQPAAEARPGPSATAPPTSSTERAVLSPWARSSILGLEARDAGKRRRAALLLQARLAGGVRLAPADRACLAVVLRQRLRVEHDPQVIVALLGGLAHAGDATDLRRLAPWLRGSGREAPAALAALAVLADRGQLGLESATAMLATLGRPEALLRRAAAWVLTRLARGVDRAALPLSCTRPACACRAPPKLLNVLTATGVAGPPSLLPSPWPAAVAGALNRCASADPDARTRALCLRAFAARADGQARAWLLRRAEDPSVWVQLEAVRALAGLGAVGAAALAGAVRALWLRAASNRQRLAGLELHPISAGLVALLPHAALSSVRLLADDLLELADAARSSVSYAPPEARSMDEVHCLAAGLHDRAAAAVERTPTCGTAHEPQLDAGWRRRQVVTTLAALARDAGWRLTLLRRYLVDAALAVRAAAVEALGVLDSPVVVPALRRAYADPSAAVFVAAARATMRVASRLDDRALDARLVEGMMARRRPPHAVALCAGSEALAALGRSPPAPLLVALARGGFIPVAECARAALLALRAGELSPPRAAAGSAWWFGGGAQRDDRSGALRRAASLQRGPQRLMLRTDRAQVTLELLWDEAPRATDYLARLIAERALEGAAPFRVVPGELVALGRLPVDEQSDPLPDDYAAGAFERGSVGLVASNGAASRAIFFTLQRQPQLDGRFPRVARVVGGIEQVEAWRAGDRLQRLDAVPAAPPLHQRQERP
ncbi:MAG: peptidylprolyl isomerase [Proteobacteria bacterium]|nr:peptidylprolyl isomerase [Pseudomonadota bacterium]